MIIPVLNEIIHILYFVFAGVFGLLLVRNLFKRDTHTGIIYDIVYAYTIIPFLLRVLHIK